MAPGWRHLLRAYCAPDFLICPACPEPSAVPPADVVLVVEVSNSSLSYDRTVKAAIYARLGVREYWFIDANSLKTMVGLAPSPGGYLTAREIGANGRSAIRASKLTAKVDPTPAVDWILRSPRWRLTMCFTIARPSPVPPFSRLDETFAR